jgi:hypothetical protein
MKILTATLLALALSATGTSAQVQITGGAPQNTAFGTDPIIRVTVSFRTAVAVEAMDPRAVPDPKAQEAARRALYDMAASECATLSETFKAECRLGSLQILPQGVLAQPANAPPVVPSLSANAVYELKPKSAVSAR